MDVAHDPAGQCDVEKYRAVVRRHRSPQLPVAVFESNALRKRSRKALIGQTGARGLGRKPSFQPHPVIRLSTAGSWAITEIGTSWLGCFPLTISHGWWSPRTISTRLRSA